MRGMDNFKILGVTLSGEGLAAYKDVFFLPSAKEFPSTPYSQCKGISDIRSLLQESDLILNISCQTTYTGCNRRNGPDFGRVFLMLDRLYGLVVRVSGYRYRGLGFDSRRYQIF